MNKVIIVGAGIAGLSAGVYAAQSGFDVTIYESHLIPGGNCTGWKRKGYFFEGGLHWLTGSDENQPLYQLWRNVGAIDDATEIINHDPFFSYDHQGQIVHIYRDLEKLRQHWLEISPSDAKAIDTLCSEVKSLSKIQMPVTDIKGVKVKEKSASMLSMLPAMLPALKKITALSRISADEYSRRFSHPALQGMLQNVVGPHFNAVSLIFTLVTFMTGDGGYLRGGSVEMAARMARRFCELGGKIEYASPVERVLVEDGVATGVIVKGSEIHADAVIVTQDTLAAKDRLFQPPLDEPWLQKMQERCKPVTGVYLSIGVRADLSHIPNYLFFSLDTPISYADQTVSTLWLCHYSQFKEYAPPGCTALVASLDGDTYDFWKQCKEDGSYAEQKQRLADAVVAAIGTQIPEIVDKVEVVDVATPLTYERYCGTYKGSWMTLTGAGDSNASYPHASQSVKMLYFAGQRLVPPGGLPVAVTTGRTAVQHLCKDTDRLFQGKM